MEIANTTVADIFDIYTEELAEKHKQKPVGRWLAIDEKHVDHQMRGIFVDGETGNLLEITENNSPETIKKTIMGLNGYENITHVTMDMANGYKAVVEEVFGIDAKIIVDKWHVLHDLATKISKSRMVSTKPKNRTQGQSGMHSMCYRFCRRRDALNSSAKRDNVS